VSDEKYLLINGTKIRYSEYGHGDFAIVFVHADDLPPLNIGGQVIFINQSNVII
jgi:hypothetical protein